MVCYVRDRRTIIVADSRRDSSLEETDSFQIILDTFHDGQNGFVFGTNPAGVEYDGQGDERGAGERPVRRLRQALGGVGSSAGRAAGST